MRQLNNHLHFNSDVVESFRLASPVVPFLARMRLHRPSAFVNKAMMHTANLVHAIPWVTAAWEAPGPAKICSSEAVLPVAVL